MHGPAVPDAREPEQPSVFIDPFNGCLFDSEIRSISKIVKLANPSDTRTLAADIAAFLDRINPTTTWFVVVGSRFCAWTLNFTRDVAFSSKLEGNRTLFILRGSVQSQRVLQVS